MTARPEPRVAARDIARRYGSAHVLRGLDLTLNAGEAVLLLGRNGAGKTTLLRLIAGLARPERGVIELDGATLAAGPAAYRRKVGFSGHRSFLYSELTPRENLRFAARLFGLPAGVVDAALADAELGAAADRPVAALSRGMIQRVALARACLHEPSVLLLDEPFTGLDAPAAERLVAELRRRAAKGAAILLVTHQIDDAWPLVSRLAVLHSGALAIDVPRPSTPAEALARYREVTRG